MTEDSQQQNVWGLKNIDEFLYYCCPECDVKDQSKENFLKHALDHHPNSKDCVLHNLELKCEPLAQEFEELDNWFDPSEYIKCEINEDQSIPVEANFAIHKHENLIDKFAGDVKNQSENEMKRIVGIKTQKKKTQQENGILVNLIKHFGLNNLEKHTPQKRNAIWIQITKEFNQINGYNWNIKKLQKRWRNYNTFLKNNSSINLEESSQSSLKDEHENINDSSLGDIDYQDDNKDVHKV